MNNLTLAAMLFSALTWAGEGPVHKPALDSFGPARYAAPAGWELQKKDSAADPWRRFTQDSDVIEIKLVGGKGSRYASSADYLAGFEATTMGKPPEKLRQARVAGLKVWIWRHGYPINLGDPHVVDPRPPQLAREEFCLIPCGKKFLVLKWAHESPIPDLNAVGKKAWESFLGSLALEKK